jgi:hypothetical protein
MLSKNIVIQAQIGRFKCCYVARLALDKCVSMIFFPFIVNIFFPVTAMYRISYSSCVALNKSVEVAQGLTTFFNLVYLGFRGGRGKWAKISER